VPAGPTYSKAHTSDGEDHDEDIQTDDKKDKAVAKLT
jgi:hypothetical protein